MGWAGHPKTRSTSQIASSFQKLVFEMKTQVSRLASLELRNEEGKERLLLKSRRVAQLVASLNLVARCKLRARDGNEKEKRQPSNELVARSLDLTSVSPKELMFNYLCRENHESRNCESRRTLNIKGRRRMSSRFAILDSRNENGESPSRADDF